MGVLSSLVHSTVKTSSNQASTSAWTHWHNPSITTLSLDIRYRDPYLKFEYITEISQQTKLAWPSRISHFVKSVIKHLVLMGQQCQQCANGELLVHWKEVWIKRNLHKNHISTLKASSPGQKWAIHEANVAQLFSWGWIATMMIDHGWDWWGCGWWIK